MDRTFFFLIAVAIIYTVMVAATARASSVQEGTLDPVVGFKGHEVVESSVWTFEGMPVAGPRYDWPNSWGRIIDDGGASKLNNKKKQKFGIVWWVIYGAFPGQGGGLINNPACDRAQGRPPFCDNVHPPVVHPPVEPPVAPVPIPGGLLHLLSAILFGAAIVRFFPQSLIDRPDRAN